MIKFLITTALTYEGHHKYGNVDLIRKRESQYKNFIEHMKSFSIPQYYCECVNNGPHTFLNELVQNDKLFYSKTHNPNIKNIGVDEINACQAALSYFDFDDNDIIIKLTGRYMLNSMMFVNEVSNNENNFDAFYHPFPFGHSGFGQMFTGAFAIRKIYYNNYLKQTNLLKMEKEMINVEYDILQYLRNHQQQIRLRALDRLDITAYSGNGQVIWQI